MLRPDGLGFDGQWLIHVSVVCSLRVYTDSPPSWPLTKPTLHVSDPPPLPQDPARHVRAPQTPLLNHHLGTLATPCTWCVVESACGVICACLPTLRPLAKKVSTKFGSSEKSKSRTTRSHGPTELVTIGGGTNSHLNSRAMTKSPFQRLDEAADGAADHDGATLHGGHGSHGLSSTAGSKKTTVTTTMTTDYASSGESDDVEAVRTRSHGQEQYGKGFV